MAHAGDWYPSDASELNQMLTEFLSSVKPNFYHTRHHQLKGLIVPHAGLEYSGRVQASAF